MRGRCLVSELELLWDYVEKHPNEDTAKRGLADKLEEDGDSITAYALRWCIKWRRWPNVTKSTKWRTGGIYYFTKAGRTKERVNQGCSLPSFIIAYNDFKYKEASLPKLITNLGKALLKRVKELEA